VTAGGSCGREIGLRALVKWRGIDLDLSPPERLVYDVIHGETGAPAGWVVLLDAS
jgi:hypothetical protein